MKSSISVNGLANSGCTRLSFVAKTGSFQKDSDYCREMHNARKSSNMKKIEQNYSTVVSTSIR